MAVILQYARKMVKSNRNSHIIKTRQYKISSANRQKGDYFMVHRVQDLQNELDTVVHQIVDNYGAERVILFGSGASDELNEESDIDLVVIKDTDASFYDRLREVAEKVEWKHACEIIVYTPDEFENMRETNSFVRDEICEKGRVLYG